MLDMCVFSRDDDKQLCFYRKSEVGCSISMHLTMEWLLTDGMKMTEYQVIFLTDRDLGR